MESLCNHGRHDPIIGPKLRPPSPALSICKGTKKSNKNNNNPNRHAKGVLLPSPGTTTPKCPFPHHPHLCGRKSHFTGMLRVCVGSVKTILLVASFVRLACSRLSKRVVCFLRKGSWVLVIISSCVATGGVGRSSSGCVLGLKTF
ncbi:hypothetical protein TNCT_41461 [Trichonephila clavata]|uniref:Uncharacterized protein n=1 Tax=Trichonephila clavata TaxID=2740835 RepID=A0A8X6FWT5_TRICU|nr:hypothetical protein TNCT_41461 [Trichonephila clavata]